MSVSDWAKTFTLSGDMYPVVSSAWTNVEEPGTSFTSHAQGAYKTNGVVFATILARTLLFTEARFLWQDLDDGIPGDLHHSRELSILEHPWPNGTTGELLARMEQDVSLAGNFFAVRDGNRLRRLRPDWVQIVLSAPPAEAVRADVEFYAYYPGGVGVGKPHLYEPEQVVHWSPIPDPEAQYRGMSWLTPVIREIVADKATTKHKWKFFENAATPNIAVSLKETVTEEQFNKFMEKFSKAHRGVENAYKTLYLGGGADVKVIGADLRQLDFKGTQGAGETRITAAGGVPAVIVGLSEGLQAATYSNYGQARRKFGDHWARPQWRSACAALSTVLTVPAATRLWYDDSDIAFLREDEKDAAEILARKMLTIESGVRGGFTPQSIVDAVSSGDLRRLEHTGLFSVQLQPPGTDSPTVDLPATLPPVEGDEKEEGLA